MIKFFLLVTNHGQPRIRKYYDYKEGEMQFEPELIKKCLTRSEHLVRHRRLADGIVYCAGSAAYQICFRLPIPNPKPITDPNPNPKNNKKKENDTGMKMNIELYLRAVACKCK